MTKKRFVQNTNLVMQNNEVYVVCADEHSADVVTTALNEVLEENEQLKSDNKCYVKRYSELFDDYIAYKKENEQLKQQLMDCKKDEKELSISFMEYKMQLIDVLQQNYNYAYNQRQKNLDKSMVARTYEVLYQTIYNIAEVMNVDIERFPKGDVE